MGAANVPGDPFSAFAGQFGGGLGQGLGKGLGNAMGGDPGPQVSSAQADQRAFMDGSGWTVSTGGGRATGGTSGGGGWGGAGGVQAPTAIDYGMSGYGGGSMVAGVNPLMLLAAAGVVAVIALRR